MCLIPLKPQFYVLLSGKNPSKLALGILPKANFDGFFPDKST